MRHTEFDWAFAIGGGYDRHPELRPLPPPKRGKPVPLLWRGVTATVDANEWVYLIQCAGKIKIGWSSGLRRRIRNFGTALPLEPLFLGAARGTRGDEGEIHHRLRFARSNGEWFENTDEVRVAVALMRKPWDSERQGSPTTAASVAAPLGGSHGQA